MLQSIRDRTQGWIAGVIISLVILSFALWGIHSYLVSGANTSVIAKVNGVEITKQQLAAAYERLHRQMQVNMGTSTVPSNVEADLKSRALQALINMQVLEQGSVSQNYHITSRQIDNFLENMPEFQVNGQFSLDRFQQLLASSMLSAGDFLNLIKTTLLIDQPRLGIVFSSFALPNEVNTAVALVNQERDVSYLMLPQSNFLNSSITVSDEEIQSYYKQHQSEFKTLEQVSIDYLELSIKDLMAGIQVGDDILKNYYNENVNSFTTPMQWQLETTVIPVAQNASEADVAKAMEQAKAQRQQYMKGEKFPGNGNGKLVSLSELPVELQKPVSVLKAGQISEPVRAPKGILLVKVDAIKQAEVQPYEQVVDKVKAALTRQKAEEKFAELKEKLANVSYESPESLDKSSKALGLPVKSSVTFTAEKGGTDISSSPKVREAAFSADVLTSQNNSDVIQVNPDTVVVLRIKSHVPASTLSVDAVKSQIGDTLRAKKADEQAAKVAHDIQVKLQQGASVQQIQQDYHTTWMSLGYIGRYSTKVDSAILYSAFRMPKPTNQPSYAAVKMANGYAVVAVNAVRDGVVKQDQYDVFAEQVQSSEGALEYKLYETSLNRNAKVVSYLNNQD